MEQQATVEVVVGRVGRAHGLRGDVGIEVRTDEPDLQGGRRSEWRRGAARFGVGG